MTLGLATEVAAEGIRVNCVRPAFVYTDMHASADEPERVDRLKSSLLLKRGSAR
jgi:NAD(P)-dependent dehydrogenase (short-subunit alcohol dehydrogenase family)